MCGIVGYIGKKEDIRTGLEALKRLEYRGYDSAGMVVYDPEKQEVLSVKATGKIENLEKKLSGIHIKGSPFLFYTRWATHGGITEENCHPHTGCKNNIWVVHNGIIENYRVLKKELEKKFGTKLFRSKTDTEVIPHLIDSLLRQGLSFEKAFVKTCQKLKGRFAFVALYKDAPFILAARDGSPLVVGRGKKEFFIASDIPAFLDYTNVVNFVENGEYIKT
ncbi:glutamine--fructose-6-phosphate aminotransferase, partial [Patescibacteria group bacterium]|nr:glutamine--fructose-6-phosphate aminotransferase [Patescibacteria group bacterium]